MAHTIKVIMLVRIKVDLLARKGDEDDRSAPLSSKSLAREGMRRKTHEERIK